MKSEKEEALKKIVETQIRYQKSKNIIIKLKTDLTNIRDEVDDKENKINQLKDLLKVTEQRISEARTNRFSVKRFSVKRQKSFQSSLKDKRSAKFSDSFIFTDVLIEGKKKLNFKFES